MSNFFTCANFTYKNDNFFKEIEMNKFEDSLFSKVSSFSIINFSSVIKVYDNMSFKNNINLIPANQIANHNHNPSAVLFLNRNNSVKSKSSFVNVFSEWLN